VHVQWCVAAPGESKFTCTKAREAMEITGFQNDGKTIVSVTEFDLSSSMEEKCFKSNMIRSGMKMAYLSINS
jgi:hypothetical protein